MSQSARPGPAPFLQKSWELVSDSSTDDVISWGKDGTTFIVHDVDEFSKRILPLHFKHSNFSSYVRQLNTYGFRKWDWSKFEFFNPHFQRGKPELLANIERRKPKVAKVQAATKQDLPQDVPMAAQLTGATSLKLEASTLPLGSVPPSPTGLPQLAPSSSLPMNTLMFNSLLNGSAAVGSSSLPEWLRGSLDVTTLQGLLSTPASLSPSPGAPPPSLSSTLLPILPLQYPNSYPALEGESARLASLAAAVQASMGGEGLNPQNLPTGSANIQPFPKQCASSEPQQRGPLVPEGVAPLGASAGEEERMEGGAKRKRAQLDVNASQSFSTSFELTGALSTQGSPAQQVKRTHIIPTSMGDADAQEKDVCNTLDALWSNSMYSTAQPDSLLLKKNSDMLKPGIMNNLTRMLQQLSEEVSGLWEENKRLRSNIESITPVSEPSRRGSDRSWQDDKETSSSDVRTSSEWSRNMGEVLANHREQLERLVKMRHEDMEAQAVMQQQVERLKKESTELRQELQEILSKKSKRQVEQCASPDAESEHPVCEPKD